VAVVSYQERHPIPGLIVRKEAKQHGGKRAIEGPLNKGARVAVVDDTCTTGSSLFMAIDAVEAAGCQVVKVITILDRREGGSEEIRRRGYDFVSLLEADESGNVIPSHS
jgi:orotate phosphoribosyltransferase